MTAVPFDTLKLADRLLEAGGFSAEEVRAFASALADALSMAEIASKHDLTGLFTKADIEVISLEFRAGLANTKVRITKWLVVAALGVQALVILSAVIAFARVEH